MTQRRERVAGDSPADLACPAAVVFDMDGLILDTERIALDGFQHACRTLGAQPNPDAYLHCIGTNLQRTRELLVEGRGPDFPVDAVIQCWLEYCDGHTARQPPPLKPGALQVLDTLRHCAIPCALATSASGIEASNRLASAGLGEYFPIRVTGDQVAKGKPDPEPYRTAAVLLGVDPKRAWALEDSANGVRSALGAGLRVFQIPDLVPPDAPTLALGHTVLDSLYDVDDLLRHCVRGSEAVPASNPFLGP